MMLHSSRLSTSRRGVPQFYSIPLSLAKGEGDTEPVLSLPKEGEGFQDRLL